MRTKIVILILMILISWWFYNRESERSKAAIEKSEELDRAETVKPKDIKPSKWVNSKGQTEQSPEIKTNYSPEQEKIILEITPYKFSPDPYVELLSLEWVLGLCIEERFIDQLIIRNGTVHPVLDDIKQKVESNCQKQRQRYPNLIDMYQNRQIRDLFKPQSELGKLLSQNKENLSLSERIVREEMILNKAIENQNSGLLMMTAMTYRWGGLIAPDILKVLNTQDLRYAQIISHIALNLLACEFSAGEQCTGMSGLMVVICLESPQNCGLDYPSWYQQNTLPGMKSDVEKMMAYYRQAH